MSRPEIVRQRVRSFAASMVLAVAVGCAGSTSADAATFVVGTGADTATVRRPHVHVDDWDSRTLSASTLRPQGTVLVWTEVTRARAKGRWWWRTYTSWCSAGRCTRPVRAMQKLRVVPRTPENSVTPWRVRVSPDQTRDRAVVKAGIRWGTHWAITSPSRLVASGPTEGVWLAGFIAITHTPDGRDWLSWNDDRQQIRVSRARDGKRLTGPVIGRGDTAKARNVGGRWVVLSLGRTADDDTTYPVLLRTATSIAGLRRARPTTLAAMGDDGLLRLFGPDDGPLLAIWESTKDIDRVTLAANAAWIDRAGTVSTPQTFDDDAVASSYLRSVPAADGDLLLCTGGLTGPLGGALTQQTAPPCANEEVAPVRLRTD